MKELKINLKRILVILMVFVTLSFFCADSLVVQAKSKLPSEGEFYYSGTTKGTYVLTEGIFAWLLNNLSGIIDWILGISTMLVRMVFVGWTVLIERLLTWVLESTMNMNIELGSVNATNVGSNANSSQNVTVEAIVYGLVPIFDINIFDTNLATNITGTGIDLSKYVCETCGKNIDTCICTACNCALCDLREHYNNGMQESTSGTGEEVTTKNTVLMVKEAVAKWYYIIRLIAIIAMLLVLIVVGIKMATTSIASEKALFKRMIVDWIVGMILLFTIQYVMIAIITVNNHLVKMIRETAMYSHLDDSGNSAGAVDVTGSPTYNQTKKSSSTIEISIYEEVRTRAYDPKLINGLTGMVLYMLLVYFAVRFSLVYFKRYFTIIVLTLMAPGVAVSYALQKVFTGKSASLSKWLTEYTMNTIIQVVHALIYAAFVSLALKVALNSVSGMIIAFVIMNHMLKCEELFRKIFKMSSGGSLLDETENAGSPEKISQKLQGAQGMFVAAKPIKNALMKSPITQIATGIPRLARNGAIIGASLVKKGIDDRKEKKIEKNMQENENENYEKFKNNKNSTEYQQMRERALMRMKNFTQRKQNLLQQGLANGGYDKDEEQALREAIYTDQRPLREGETEEERRKESSARWAKYSQIHKDNKWFKKQTNMTTTGIAKAHLGKLLDYNNYFVREQQGDSSNGEKLKLLKGKWVFDEKTKAPVYLSGAMGSVNKQLTSEELLGFTKQDKQQAKQVAQFAAKGLLGAASMFVGLGTFVAHPKLGMGLLATGTSQTTKMLGRNKKRVKSSQRIHGNQFVNEGFEDVTREYEEPRRPEKYTFVRFNSGAMLTMQAELEHANEDDLSELGRQNIERVKTKNPELVENLDNVKATTGKKNRRFKRKERKEKRAETTINLPEIPEIESAQLHTEELDRIVRQVSGENTSNGFIEDNIFGGIGEKISENNLSHFRQIKSQTKKEKKVAIAMISRSLEEEFKQKYAEINGLIDVTEEVPSSTDLSRDRVVPEIMQQTRKDIKSVKDVNKIVEVAILEEVLKSKKSILQFNVDDASAQKNIKLTIEDILHQKNGIESGQHVEDVIENIDTEIKDAKSRLDKASKIVEESESDDSRLLTEQSDDAEVKTETQDGTTTVTKKKSVKSILREALQSGESEEEFIKKLTGFDVNDQSDSTSTTSSQKTKQDKVVELLLLQKQMREMNEEAIKLKMKPTDANKRYEQARTFVYDDRKSRGLGSTRKEESKNYGPVTDIVGLISNL